MIRMATMKTAIMDRVYSGNHQAPRCIVAGRLRAAFSAPSVRGGLSNAYVHLLFWLSLCMVAPPLHLAHAHLPHDDVSLMQISPNFHEDHLLLVTARNNLLRSTDGGETWKRMVNGLDYRSTLTAIAISDDVEEGKTIFVSSEKEGIFKSEDGGESWKSINREMGKHAVSQLYLPRHYKEHPVVFAAGANGGLFKMRGDGSAWESLPGGEGKRITRITNEGMFADRQLMIGDREGNIFLYDDNEVSWKPVIRLDGCGSITAIGLFPDWQKGGKILIGTEKGGLFMADGDSEPLKISVVPGEQPIMSIAFSPGYPNDRTIFATTWNEAVYISRDGGGTWEKEGDGLTKDVQADEGRLPHFREIRISNGFSADKTIFINGFDGLFKSTDGGASWRQLETLPASIIVGFDVSPEYRDAKKILLSTYGGAAFLLDRTYGDAWNVLNDGLGYSAIRRTAIHFSPNYYRDSTIFSTSNDSFLVSHDDGRHWNSFNIRNINWLPQRVEKLLKIGRFSKTEYNRPFVPTMIMASPDYASDHTVFTSTRKHGLLRSRDGGESFQSVWGKNQHDVDSMVVSPRYSEDRTLYLSSQEGKGIYRSNDGGDTWVEAGKGVENDDRAVLAISPGYKEDKTVFAGTSRGLFKTISRGESWRKLEIHFGVTDHVDAVAVSPDYANDRELMISIRGRGLFRSRDGGETFSPIAQDLIAKNQSLTMYMRFPERPDPIKYSSSYAADRTIYAISGEELFVSEDGGDHWMIIERPVRYEDIRNDVIVYKNPDDWKREYHPEQFKGHRLSSSSITVSAVPGASATYRFYGTGVSWLGTENNDQGIAVVSVDGKFIEKVDQYRPAPRTGARLFSIQDLPRGSHEIMIEVSDQKNEKSTGFTLAIDAMDVFP